MTSTVFAKIQMRRGTATEWANANPILAEGEFAFEIDTGITKVGDGASDYAALPAYATYSQMLAAQEAIEAGQTQLATFNSQLTAAQNAATTSVAKASEAFVSAGNAKGSEDAAEVSASQAEQSAIDAAASGVAAAGSEERSAASKVAAAASAAAAIASEEAAAASAANSAASEVVAFAARALVEPLAAEIQIVSDNMATVQSAAGDLDAINSSLVQMAIDYADSNARYVAAHGVI